jgi:hypothetical protein
MHLVKISIAVCAVFFFASLMIPNKIEIKINHHHHLSNSITMHHDFDFGGNLHKPICIYLGNPGLSVPLKVDVTHKGSK